MDDLLTQLGDMLRAVFPADNPLRFLDPDVWKDVLARPGAVAAAFVLLNAVVFTETGLLVGFFLPGDSLLVTAGVVAHLAGWNVGLLIATLCVAAVVGDTVGYGIGAKAGPAIFRRPDGRFFRQSHLMAAKAFYDRHGGKTIIFARFVPIVRTFAPVVAGAARMEYRTFLVYNVIGGVAWVVSMVLFGYTLNLWADALLRPVFGPQFRIEKHIDKVAVLVILVSVLPIAWKAANEWRAKRAKPIPEPVAAGKD
jgi:membrane-associated protein